jgi:5-methylcytosine-specific restriction enzyme A
MPTRPKTHRPQGPKRERSYRVEDSHRGTARERGYDRTWEKLSKAYLMAHPLCQCDDCMDGTLKVTAANVVDHIQPIALRPDLRLVWSNLRAMNKRCHDRHTGRTRGTFARRGGR